MSSHDCTARGHVWIESGSGKLMVRHRGRPPGTIRCQCLHCPAVAELEAYAKHTAPPLPGAVPSLAQVPKP